MFVFPSPERPGKGPGMKASVRPGKGYRINNEDNQVFEGNRDSEGLKEY